MPPDPFHRLSRLPMPPPLPGPNPVKLLRSSQYPGLDQSALDLLQQRLHLHPTSHLPPRPPITGLPSDDDSPPPCQKKTRTPYLHGLAFHIFPPFKKLLDLIKLLHHPSTLPIPDLPSLLDGILTDFQPLLLAHATSYNQSFVRAVAIFHLRILHSLLLKQPDILSSQHPILGFLTLSFQPPTGSAPHHNNTPATQDGNAKTLDYYNFKKNNGYSLSLAPPLESEKDAGIFHHHRPEQLAQQALQYLHRSLQDPDRRQLLRRFFNSTQQERFALVDLPLSRRLNNLYIAGDLASFPTLSPVHPPISNTFDPLIQDDAPSPSLPHPIFPISTSLFQSPNNPISQITPYPEELYDPHPFLEAQASQKRFIHMMYIIAYDIADPARLRKVAKICEDYGIRVEKSVFECDLKEAAFTNFWSKLSAAIHHRQDVIIAYRIGRCCLPQATSLGLYREARKPILYIF